MTNPNSQPTEASSPPPETTEDMAHLALGSGRYPLPEAITAIRIVMARFEAKLDSALQSGKDFAEFEEEMIKEIHLLDKRLVKLESWQGTLMWVAGTAVTLGGAAIGAAVSFFLQNGGTP